MTEVERHLTYDLVFNLRDLGGYEAAGGRAVKWRTLFRADGVHRLAPEAFTELGIRTVLDLRTHGEIEERGRAEGDHDWHHLPMLKTIWQGSSFTEDMSAERFLADRYLVMLDEGAESLVTILGLLADPERLPAVFHCAAGKDRTGVVAAVVLALLGVDDDVIAHDYGLSRLGMDRMVDYIRVTYPDRYDAMSDQPSAFMQAPEAAMRLFLADVEAAYGSLPAYVESLGVDAGTVERLRSNLLV